MSAKSFIRSVKTIQAIEVISTMGHGLKDDPYRTITQYYSLDGKLLAESDSLDEDTKESNVHL